VDRDEKRPNDKITIYRLLTNGRPRRYFSGLLTRRPCVQNSVHALYLPFLSWRTFRCVFCQTSVARRNEVFAEYSCKLFWIAYENVPCTSMGITSCAKNHTRDSRPVISTIILFSIHMRVEHYFRPCNRTIAAKRLAVSGLFFLNSLS